MTRLQNIFQLIKSPVVRFSPDKSHSLPPLHFLFIQYSNLLHRLFDWMQLGTTFQSVFFSLRFHGDASNKRIQTTAKRSNKFSPKLPIHDTRTNEMKSNWHNKQTMMKLITIKHHLSREKVNLYWMVQIAQRNEKGLLRKYLSKEALAV